MDYAYIVYCSLLQFLTLVYPGWGQKSEFFCLLVTTRRLQSGTPVGYHSTTTAYCWYTAAKGHWSTPGQGKGQSTAPRCCVPGGHIQGHWGVYTVVPGSLHEKSVLWICHHDGSVTNHSTDAEHLILRRDQKLMLFVNIIQPCIWIKSR